MSAGAAAEAALYEGCVYGVARLPPPPEAAVLRAAIVLDWSDSLAGGGDRRMEFARYLDALFATAGEGRCAVYFLSLGRLVASYSFAKLRANPRSIVEALAARSELPEAVARGSFLAPVLAAADADHGGVNGRVPLVLLSDGELFDHLLPGTSAPGRFDLFACELRGGARETDRTYGGLPFEVLAPDAPGYRSPLAEIRQYDAGDATLAIEAAGLHLLDLTLVPDTVRRGRQRVNANYGELLASGPAIGAAGGARLVFRAVDLRDDWQCRWVVDVGGTVGAASFDHAADAAALAAEARGLSPAVAARDLARVSGSLRRLIAQTQTEGGPGEARLRDRLRAMRESGDANLGRALAAALAATGFDMGAHIAAGTGAVLPVPFDLGELVAGETPAPARLPLPGPSAGDPQLDSPWVSATLELRASDASLHLLPQANALRRRGERRALLAMEDGTTTWRWTLTARVRGARPPANMDDFECDLRSLERGYDVGVLERCASEFAAFAARPGMDLAWWRGRAARLLALRPNFSAWERHIDAVGGALEGADPARSPEMRALWTGEGALAVPARALGAAVVDDVTAVAGGPSGASIGEASARALAVAIDRVRGEVGVALRDGLRAAVLARVAAAPPLSISAALDLLGALPDHEQATTIAVVLHVADPGPNPWETLAGVSKRLDDALRISGLASNGVSEFYRELARELVARGRATTLRVLLRQLAIDAVSGESEPDQLALIVDMALAASESDVACAIGDELYELAGPHHLVVELCATFAHAARRAEVQAAYLAAFNTGLLEASPDTLAAVADALRARQLTPLGDLVDERLAELEPDGGDAQTGNTRDGDGAAAMRLIRGVAAAAHRVGGSAARRRLTRRSGADAESVDTLHAARWQAGAAVTAVPVSPMSPRGATAAARGTTVDRGATVDRELIDLLLDAAAADSDGRERIRARIAERVPSQDEAEALVAQLPEELVRVRQRGASAILTFLEAVAPPRDASSLLPRYLEACTQHASARPHGGPGAAAAPDSPAGPESLADLLLGLRGAPALEPHLQLTIRWIARRLTDPALIAVGDVLAGRWHIAPDGEAATDVLMAIRAQLISERDPSGRVRPTR